MKNPTIFTISCFNYPVKCDLVVNRSLQRSEAVEVDGKADTVTSGEENMMNQLISSFDLGHARIHIEVISKYIIVSIRHRQLLFKCFVGSSLNCQNCKYCTESTNDSSIALLMPYSICLNRSLITPEFI